MPESLFTIDCCALLETIQKKLFQHQSTLSYEGYFITTIQKTGSNALIFKFKVFQVTCHHDFQWNVKNNTKEKQTVLKKPTKTLRLQNLLNDEDYIRKGQNPRNYYLPKKLIASWR